MMNLATTTSVHAEISSIGDIIEDARKGRMFILMDDDTRENEGDLILPAQHVTPAAINFMVTHGRGLVCLPMAGQMIDALGLPLIGRGDALGTAFTLPIDARTGISTGISAADRAHTIKTAIAPQASAADIVTPGHVFPLRAQDGGVLARRGHTEASVDIARLAGLAPAAVICEIMNEDGTMARRSDLLAYARRHALKIGTIADLVAWRQTPQKGQKYAT